MEESSKIKTQYRTAQGECDIRQVYALKFSWPKFILVALVSICNGFMFLLTLHWFTNWRRKCLYNFCLWQEATHYYIKNWDSSWSVAAQIPLETGIYESGQESGYGFDSRHMRYYFNRRQNYVAGLEFDSSQFVMNENTIMKNIGVDEENGDYAKRVSMFGQCEVNVPVPSYLQLFVLEILHPFFIFNCYSTALWIYEEYIIFAYFIFSLSFVSAIINLIMVRLNMVNIHEMAYRVTQVHVLRKNQDLKRINSNELVPGDVLFLREQDTVPCDGILLDGNILLNESSLTGESVPVLKVKFDNNILYNEKTNKNNSVYEGTQVIQISNLTMRGGYVLPQDEGQLVPILVTRTGYMTNRGSLIRSILYPKPHSFTFFQESLKFIFILFLFSIVGYCILINRFLETLTTEDMIVKFLDLFTITVPPTLPASLHVGITYSVYRLKAKNIFCISPPKTVVGGRVKTVNFDKTGTLTAQGMDLVGLYPVINKVFFQTGLIEKDRKNDTDIKNSEQFRQILNLMACCHTLSRLEKKLSAGQQNGSVIGDDMELRMFQFAYADLPIYTENDIVMKAKVFDEHGKKGAERDIRVLKRFQFTSELQRMSVLAEVGGKTYLFLKGAPEVVSKLSKEVPPEYQVRNDENAKKGFRLLALAWREVSEKIDTQQSYKRENFENNLNFAGLVVFDNPVQKQTKPTMQKLREADIQMKIVTGDNPLTALAVSRQCNLVPQNADVFLIDFDLQRKRFIIQQQMADIGETENLKVAEHNDEKRPLNSNEPENQIPLAPPALIPDNTKANGNQVMDIQDAHSYPEHVREFQKEIANRKNEIFAFTGAAFNELYVMIEPDQELLDMLLTGQIFARMKPNHKSVLVEHLQHLGEQVAMVGDGANDVGALKQADIGLALSTAEASISAPFTARNLNIDAIHDLLVECRAGLSASFSMFQFMATYSMLQFTSTILCYWYYAFFSNNFYLDQDAVYITPLFIVMGFTYSSGVLTKERPREKLLSGHTLLSVFGFGLIQAICQIVTVLQLETTNSIHFAPDGEGGSGSIPVRESVETHRKYYVANEQMDDCTIQGTSIWLVSIYLYFTASYTMSISTPFRKSQLTNIPYDFVLIFCYIYAIVCARIPEAFFADFEEEELDQYNYLIQSDWTIECILYGHMWAAIVIIYEKIILNQILTPLLQLHAE